MPRTVFDNDKENHFYDQIAWFSDTSQPGPVLTLEARAGGHIDFVPELRGDRTLNALSWHISDHYPLWVEFKIPAP